MSTGDGRLQAELPGFVMVSSRKRPSCYTLYDLVMVCLVMVSWGHVLVAHTLHNVASLPRLCIPHGNVNHSCQQTRLRTISDA